MFGGLGPYACDMSHACRKHLNKPSSFLYTVMGLVSPYEPWPDGFNLSLYVMNPMLMLM
jgi:hypothetical protein